MIGKGKQAGATDGGGRSIYDGDDEDDNPWFLRHVEDDEDAPPATTDLLDWREAERDQARALADTARGLGRLEQALTLHGGVARLALIEASDLLWLEGIKIRPERLSMFHADRGSEPVADRADYALGLWAVERLTGDWTLSDEEALRRFLGRRRIDEADDALADIASLPSLPVNAATRSDWLTAHAAARELHPITQAACLADLWRRSGPGGRERDLEATVIAARIAADDGPPFIPLTMGARRRIAGTGGGAGGAGAILARFLEAAQGGAQRALLELGRMADWRARVAAAPLKKNPASLISLLDAEYAITTARAEAHLGSVRQTALTSLYILREQGLVREITGGKSFLYWTADLTGLGRRDG